MSNDKSYSNDYINGRNDAMAEIINLIDEHQKECDALDIVATAEWVKAQLMEVVDE